MIVVGLALSVASSLALNAGFLLQHVGSASAPAVDVRAPLATVRGLARSRVWLCGASMNLIGSGLHIGALAAAPLTLVQAFSAGGLALVAPAAARLAGCPLDRAERVAVAWIVAALAVLAVEPATTSLPPASAGSVSLFFAGVVVAAAVLATTAGPRGGAALALAAGLLYGLSDAATKAFTAAAGHGLFAALVTPWPPAVVALCVAAFFAFQRGLQLGAPAAVIMLMTAAMNVTAATAGVAVFAESFGAHPATALAHVLAMTAVVVASLHLVAAQARATSPGQAATESGLGAAAARNPSKSRKAAASAAATCSGEAARSARPSVMPSAASCGASASAHPATISTVASGWNCTPRCGP
jgi:hypothetical protein